METEGTKTPDIVLEHDGESYRWNEKTGFIDSLWMKPPAGVVRILERLLTEKLRAFDESVNDPFELTRMASLAREQGHLSRAESLAVRALDLDHTLSGAAAVLSSVYRARGKAKDALRVTEPFERDSHVAILTTRAAAFLDVGNCDAARRLIKRAWAISKSVAGSGSGELHLVFQRLEKECGS